jgi:hypothetical protein
MVQIGLRFTMQRRRNTGRRVMPLVWGILCWGWTTGCAPTVPPHSTAGATMPTAGTPLGLAANPNVIEISPDQLPPIAVGQVVYVPVYSEIYDLGPNRPFQLTATLSLRNTDPASAVFIETVDYYDSSGALVTAYLSQPLELGPLASTAIVVESSNTLGGAGANFLVTWRAATLVSPPVIEAVMISTASQQGVSFVSPGRVIAER